MPATTSRFTLQDVLISGVRLSDSAEAPPSAEVTLVYGRITIEYRPQMPDGSLGQRWPAAGT
jgi:type VI protein secretion system component Hcp